MATEFTTENLQEDGEDNEENSNTQTGIKQDENLDCDDTSEIQTSPQAEIIEDDNLDSKDTSESPEEDSGILVNGANEGKSSESDSSITSLKNEISKSHENDSVKNSDDTQPESNISQNQSDLVNSSPLGDTTESSLADLDTDINMDCERCEELNFELPAIPELKPMISELLSESDELDDNKVNNSIDDLSSDPVLQSSGDVQNNENIDWDNSDDEVRLNQVDSDDDDEEDIMIDNRNPLAVLRERQKHRKDKLFSSSDESDSSTCEENEENDSLNKRKRRSKTGKVIKDILQKRTPLPNWYVVPELRQREYGYSSRESAWRFRDGVQGSMQMVKRLSLADSLNYHEGCVNALSFNRIGTLLASGSDDLNVVLWNWQDRKPAVIYDSGHRGNVFQVKFMPYSGDRIVISCARDGQVRLADLTAVDKNTRKLAQHRGAAHKLAVEQDSPNVFLSCGEDALTFLFDLREEKPHRLVTSKENNKKVPLYSIHSNPSNPRQFCVGGRDSFIRVYDKRKISESVDGGLVKKLCPDHLLNTEFKATVTCACYNYNGTEILASYNDEDIYLFDSTHSDGANYIHKYSGHRNCATVKGVNFYGPRSEFIVSGSDCGNLYLWDKETEAVLNFQEGDASGVINVLEPHPTMPLLATSGLDHDVKLWLPGRFDTLDTGRLKRTVKKNYREREEERDTSQPEVVGGQMLWLLLHHFRDRSRRRMREAGEQVSSSDEETDSHSNDSDGGEMQCAQS